MVCFQTLNRSKCKLSLEKCTLNPGLKNFSQVCSKENELTAINCYTSSVSYRQRSKHRIIPAEPTDISIIKGTSINVLYVHKEIKESGWGDQLVRVLS